MDSQYRPYIIGIAGGTASGKTTMANTIVKKVGSERVVYITHDSYYRDLVHLPEGERFKTNFDHPDALDTPLLISHLQELRAGRSVEIPLYDFRTCTRLAQTQRTEPRGVVIVDGILVLADEALRDIFDLKIYVDLEADERLLRRLERDVVERGRTVQSVLEQYQNTVRPMHDQFVEPSKQYADIVVPGKVTKSPALEVIAGQVLGRIEVTRRMSTLDALQSIGIRLLSSSESQASVLNKIVEVAGKEMSADNVTLHQYDAEHGGFLDPEKFSATWPPGGRLAKPRKDGVTEYVVRNGTISISDIRAEKNRELVQTAHLGETETRAFLGVQLEAGNEILGVLFFNYHTQRSFGIDEKALANILGTYAALAIQSARFYGNIQARATHLQTLSQVTSRLLVADYASVKNEIVRIAWQEMHAESVTLHLYDTERSEFLDPEKFSATWPPGGRLEKPRADGFSAYVIANGTYEVTDTGASKYAKLTDTAHLEETKTRAALGIRLEAGEEVLGVLFFNYSSPRKFREDEKAFVNVLSFYLSAAILNTRLIERNLMEQRAKVKAEEALGMIETDFHHFVKNKIALIKLDAQDLMDSPRLNLAPNQRNMLKAIHENAMAAISKLELSMSSRNPASPHWMGIDELIEETRELILTPGLAAGIQLRVNVPTHLPKVYVDRLRTSFVFAELILNAQKAVIGAERREGWIEISAGQASEQDYVEVRVANDGPPIPQERWEDIFQGLRLSAQGGLHEFGGTGLWRARTLIEAQGGKIRVKESTPAQTVFVVYLPTDRHAR